MKAATGDWVIVEANHLLSPRRRGRIVEIRGEDGAPPYLVHWADTGAETLIFPGPDTHVVPDENAPG